MGFTVPPSVTELAVISEAAPVVAAGANTASTMTEFEPDVVS